MDFRLPGRYTFLTLLTTVCLLGVPNQVSAQTQDEFFSDSVIQDVRLAMNGRDWQTLKATFDENTYYPADLTWRGITVRNIGIRSRGSGTRNPFKPGLRIDFNRYTQNQGFLGLTAVDLKNMYTDPSLLRESVAMKIYARMGIPASREAHARLYVNNEYAGIYVIVESVDRTFVARAFGAAEADVENGGYLFDYQWVFSYEFEYLGHDLKAYAPLFEPETRDTDAIVNVYGPIEEMIRAANESSDQEFVSAAGAFLDLPLFMKYLAVELFTVEWDGFTGNWGTNNFYLYRFRQTKRSQLIPWDRDHAFAWDGTHALDFIQAPIMLRLETNVLARRAVAVPSLRQVFLDALMQCAQIAAEPAPGDSRGWLEREIDRQASQIAGAVTEDPVFPFSVDEFQAEIDFLRTFARVRPLSVSCQVARSTMPVDDGQDCSLAVDLFARQLLTTTARSR
jgi:CotH protein